MVAAALAAQQRKRLEQKGKHRPDKMVRGKFPDGSCMLGKLPARDRKATSDVKADDKYCDAIDKIASVYGRLRRSETTAAEHRMYMRVIDDWLVREGFGSYIDADVDKCGRLLAVRARRNADGTNKVIRPQMLIAHLLQMAQGASSTPKGGHARDIAARAAKEAVTACGKRSMMKRTKGAFGYMGRSPMSLGHCKRTRSAYMRCAHSRLPK